LRHLHQSKVAHFIQSPGFGVTRMERPRLSDLMNRDDDDPVPQLAASHQDPPEADDATASFLRALPEIPPRQRPPQSALSELHGDGLLDFLNPRRYGFVESRERVVGFRPHQFAQRPYLRKPAPTQPTWQVDRLELVSLLTHEQPVVYVSKYLPRMDELRNAPTRPLDSFERRALPSLQRGEELHVEYFRDHLRALGSLRALKQCVRCHEAEPGDLLGAFSYILRPAPEEP
jgi:hypothetical protein